MEVVYIVQTAEPDAELIGAFPTKTEAEVWMATKSPKMENLYVVKVLWKPGISPEMSRDLPRTAR